MNSWPMKTILLAALVTAFLLPAQTTTQSAKKIPSLELLVVGSGGPRAFGRASTCYVVLLDGTPRILVDAGPGAFLEMGKLGHRPSGQVLSPDPARPETARRRAIEMGSAD